MRTKRPSQILREREARTYAVLNAQEYGRGEITVLCSKCHRCQTMLTLAEARQHIQDGWTCPMCS